MKNNRRLKTQIAGPLAQLIKEAELEIPEGQEGDKTLGKSPLKKAGGLMQIFEDSGLELGMGDEESKQLCTNAMGTLVNRYGYDVKKIDMKGILGGMRKTDGSLNELFRDRYSCGLSKVIAKGRRADGFLTIENGIADIVKVENPRVFNNNLPKKKMAYRSIVSLVDNFNAQQRTKESECEKDRSKDNHVSKLRENLNPLNTKSYSHFHTARNSTLRTKTVYNPKKSQLSV